MGAGAAMRDSLYSQVIGGLKLVLPLAALGLLSTIFLLSRTVEPESSVPLLEDEGAIPGRDTVTAPYYTGSTPEGHAVAITADTASPMPDHPEGIVAEQLKADFGLTDGSSISIVARTAAVNEPDDHLELTGDVVIDSSQGYRVRTDALVSALRSIRADSPVPVEATGPIGTLQAGRFRVREEAGTGNVQLFFTNGVKLVYEPAKQQSGDP